MDDQTLTERITALVNEEQQLLEQPGHDKQRLGEVELMLDQLWDLLRQRRSREEFGQDPEKAKPRDPSTVEGYLQ